MLQQTLETPNHPLLSTRCLWSWTHSPLTTHVTFQEQLLACNSRCRQMLNTALCSVLDLFMPTFPNLFYCFINSGLPLYSFKVSILHTFKSQNSHTRARTYLYLLFYSFFPFGVGKLKVLCYYYNCPSDKSCRVCNQWILVFAGLLRNFRRELQPPENQLTTYTLRSEMRVCYGQGKSELLDYDCSSHLIFFSGGEMSEHTPF